MAGLYLHIPFCRRKCIYCDFYSIEAPQEELKQYVELLLRHIAWIAAQGSWRHPIETIYFGGGTPSLLKPADIGAVLETINRHFTLTEDAEISLEANPGTVTPESLSGYRAAGINRLSLGLQTCDDIQLSRLGRLHDFRDGQEAVKWARQAGFDNLSLDLMFALPGQTLQSLAEDLQVFLDLAPEHLSCYGLTAEPHTRLHEKVSSDELALPDENFYAEAFMLIDERLSKAGYQHYEIANYAREGLACRHNLGYWQRKPYLGIGAGAHSFQAENWGSRWQSPNDLSAYRKALYKGQKPARRLETFDRAAALRETLYLALRTRAGITDSELLKTFGCTLEQAFPDAVKSCQPWLTNDSGRWSFTPAGWLLFDHLILHFL